MKTDPIEVLREAVVNWQLHRHGADADPGSPANMRYDEACDRLDAALASLSAPKHKAGDNMGADPGHVQGSEWVLVPMEPTSAMVAEAHAVDTGHGVWPRSVYARMLAAAPKPPPMNDNAVAVNESAPVNDKPDSAEAVDPDAYAIIDEFVQCANVGRSVGKLYRAAQDWLALADARREARPAPPRPEASKWERIIGNWQERVAAAGFNGVEEAIEAIEASIAPQQASAPVGVEGRLAAVVRFLMGEAPLEGRWFDDPGDPHSGSAYWWRKHLTEALAQQPAAVDGATRRDAERYRYLRRPEAWKENWITERGASAIFIGDGRRAEAKDGEALDAAIDRILAGQQHGGPKE